MGCYWRIDRDIYEEFLNVLPPRYQPAGFTMIEYLTSDVTAYYLKVGNTYWCAYVRTGFKGDIDRAYRVVARHVDKGEA